MKQLVFIHGGETFATYQDYLHALRTWEWNPFKLREKRWKDTLPDALPDHEILMPPMPNKYHARYEEWKIWFDKVVPFLFEDVVLVGHSLGGIFLVKYLSENDLPVKVRATILVAAPFDDQDSEYTLADFVLPESLDRLAKQGGTLHFFQSEDDRVVPFRDMEKYRAKLPSATYHAFADRGHFLQEEFPELIALVESFD